MGSEASAASYCESLKFYDRARKKLETYCRYLGWLHAPVRQPKKKLTGKNIVNHAERSRLDRIREDGGESPELPPIGYGQFLVHNLWEFGPSDLNIEPISFAELKSWNDATAANMNSWEILTMRKMSECYCTWYHRGKDPVCETPWQTIRLSSDTLARKIKRILPATSSKNG